MRAFQSGEVHKEYLAIVEGAPPDAFSVDAPIAEGTGGADRGPHRPPRRQARPDPLRRRAALPP